MDRQYHIEHNGKKYTLEFVKRSVVKMEDDGFRVKEIDDKPMKSFYQLFAGALYKHHSDLTEKEIADIFDEIDLDFGRLAKMFEYTYKSLNPEGETNRAAKE